jgi:hypothetical protein
VQIIVPLWQLCRFSIQDDSGGMVNILGGDSVGHCGEKKVCLNMCLIVSGYRDRTA